MFDVSSDLVCSFVYFVLFNFFLVSTILWRIKMIKIISLCSLRIFLTVQCFTYCLTELQDLGHRHVTRQKIGPEKEIKQETQLLLREPKF